MRSSVQRRDAVFVDASILNGGGVPQTGLTVTAKIQRVSDGFWWSGTAWVSSPATAIGLDEVDVSAMPGYYRFEFDPDDLDMELGSNGYLTTVSELTQPFTETVTITVVDEPSVLPIGYQNGPYDNGASASDVIPGFNTRLSFSMATDPPVSGLPGSFSLVDMSLAVGSDVADYADLTDDYSLPKFAERTVPASGGASTTVSGTPSFSSAGGPAGEDVYVITVASSASFSVGNLVRALETDDRGRHAFRVLQKPSPTTMKVHCSTGTMDVVSGDTLVEVTGTGVYDGILDLTTDDYLSAADQSGRFQMSLATVTAGNGPAWQNTTVVAFVVELSLNASIFDYGTG